jgi:hypothetical protein
VPRARPCLEDPTFDSIRCSFWLPDLFLVLRIPEPVPPFSSYQVDWSIQPWSFPQAPFQTSAALLRPDGQWLPQTVQPPQGVLREWTPVRGRIAGVAPAESASLKTQVRYWLPGSNSPRAWELEVLLPVGAGNP